MKSKIFCILGILVIFLGFPQTGAAFIDLTSWSVQGYPGNGTWTVNPNTLVTQSIDNKVSFFVSDTSYGYGTYHGFVNVHISGDDFVGVVAGYSHPIAALGDPQGLYDFVFIDWKKADQGSGGYTAQEGFSLVRVNGTFDNSFFSPVSPYFWGHVDNPAAGFDVLATDYRDDNGYANNTPYEFTLVYLSDHITFAVKGGTGYFQDGVTVFDIAGSFPTGYFGFYCGGQEAQFYNLEFTPVPLPGAVWLLGSGLLGLAGRRFRKH